MLPFFKTIMEFKKVKEIIQEILEDAKKAYKEAVVIENELLEDKILSIITNAKILLNQMQNNKTSSYEIDEDEEIKKIKRRVPKWIKNPNQYNAKILNTFMKLSKNNQLPIVVSTLQIHSSLDSDIFYKNYNQMKNIGERNHGKVFEEENGNVSLWKPVADYIVNLYKGGFYEREL